MALNTEVVKKDFPILERTVHGKRLVYLDSASSSQKPQAVIDAMERYYETFGRPWERQAWIKARPCAGDLELGAEVLATRGPFVFPRLVAPNVLDDGRELNRRIKRELVRGSGGVFEITVDGALKFSKQAVGRFPTDAEIDALAKG